MFAATSGFPPNPQNAAAAAADSGFFPNPQNIIMIFAQKKTKQKKHPPSEGSRFSVEVVGVPAAEAE